MLNARRARAAELLYRHWRDGTRIDRLPDEIAPTTRAEGYAIQACLERFSAVPLFGWKIAATSRDGQRHINVDGPLAGRLLAERVHEAGATVRIGGNAMRVAEPEFAFRMGRDLAPRASAYDTDEVLDAVASLHPAIELPDSRFADCTRIGAPGLIADNACANDFVLGPASEADWRSLDLAGQRVIGGVSEAPTREGSGANVLDDPRLALTWLVNELSGLGIAVRAGQVVTTGTCLVPLPIGPGDRVTANFGDLGRIGVTLA